MSTPDNAFIFDPLPRSLLLLLFMRYLISLPKKREENEEEAEKKKGKYKIQIASLLDAFLGKDYLNFDMHY